jgi:hypothetical protein
MSALLPSARMGRFVGTLHAILQPFLLRRMKVDVLGAYSLLFTAYTFFRFCRILSGRDVPGGQSC